MPRENVQLCGPAEEAATELLPESEVEPGACSALIDAEPVEVTLRWSAVALCSVPPLMFAPVAGFVRVLPAGALGCGGLIGVADGERVAALAPASDALWPVLSVASLALLFAPLAFAAALLNSPRPDPRVRRRIHHGCRRANRPIRRSRRRL
jgi:hypothetical protein